MIRSFHIGVKALIVKEGKVLVLKEKDIRGTGDEIYDLPGGRIEDEESPEETLGREIKEELGVENFEIKDLFLASKYEHYSKDGISYMALFYHVDIEDTEIKLSDEHFSYEWIDGNDLERIALNREKMHKDFRRAIEIALKDFK